MRPFRLHHCQLNRGRSQIDVYVLWRHVMGRFFGHQEVSYLAGNHHIFPPRCYHRYQRGHFQRPARYDSSAAPNSPYPLHVLPHPNHHSEKWRDSHFRSRVAAVHFRFLRTQFPVPASNPRRDSADQSAAGWSLECRAGGSGSLSRYCCR